MENRTRSFLDLLPAPHATLREWKTKPPVPLLLRADELKGDLTLLTDEEYLDKLAWEFEDCSQVDLGWLVYHTIQTFALYNGLKANDAIRTDAARILYQLICNVRDMTLHLLEDPFAEDDYPSYVIDIVYYN